MPFTGGYSPGPERTGGADGSSGVPALQRVFESLAQARGATYDQTLDSAVGAENMALARAIYFDLFEANQRFANEMNPAYATAGGLLPRWEAFLAQPALPGDAESARRARVAAALARFGVPNTYQPVIDAIVGVIGSLYVGLTLFGPSNALTWWPGLGGGTATIASVAGTNLVFVTGLASIPSSAGQAEIVISNASVPANNGTFPVHSWVTSTAVMYVNPNAVAVDYGIGGNISFPKIQWTMPYPPSPWTSSVAHVDVLVNPKAVPGYVTPAGTLAPSFWAKMNQIDPILDLMLPADVTYNWYINSSHASMGLYLDEQNLDCEAFGH